MVNCSAGSLSIRNKFCGGLQKHALVLLILLQLSQNEQYERVISGFAQTFSMPGQIRVITVDRHKRRQADIVEPPARTNTLCCRSWFPLSGCPARRFSVSFPLRSSDAGEYGGAKAPVGSGDGAGQGRTEAAAPAHLDFCLRTGTFCLVLRAVFGWYW